METASESNTVAAAVVFLAGVAVDALTALDPPTPTEAPTAMRSSAVVLVACLASPPIREWMVFEQRLAIALPLAIVAFLGWHEVGSNTRIGDALYTSLTLGACIATFWGGDGNKLQTKVSKGAPPYLKREALASLAMSILFYSSVRLLRHAVRHPVNVVQYRIVSEGLDGAANSVGYASSNSMASAALALGAAAGIGAACVLGANKEMRARGTGAATLVLASSAFVQLAAAVVATLAGAQQLVNLPAIWSEAACGDAELCAPAVRARRFAVANGCTAALWLNGFGALLMAYAPSLRLKTRESMENLRRNFEITLYGCVSVVVCVAVVVSQLSFTGGEALTDYAVVAALIAVAVTAFVDKLAGPLLFLLAIGADMIQIWSAYGTSALLGHFTHCSNFVGLILLATYLLLTLGVDLAWRLLPTRLVEAADRTAGAIVVAGTSLAALLFFGSCALYASFDGALIAQAQYRAGDGRYERTTAIFVAEHFLPLLLWLPLYACRCEVELLGATPRAAAWYAAPLAPILIWLFALSGSSLALNHAHAWTGEATFIVGVGIVGLVPWLAAVWA